MCNGMKSLYRHTDEILSVVGRLRKRSRVGAVGVGVVVGVVEVAGGGRSPFLSPPNPSPVPVSAL